MLTFVKNILAAQRNAAALAAAKADLSALERKFRNIVSHATGGAFTDIKASLNDIAVEISASKNRVFNEAIVIGAERKAAELAGDLLHSMHEVERKVLVELHDDVGVRLATIGDATGLKVDEVRTIVRGFAIKGLAFFGPLVDMDYGTPKGSGYLLTPEGADLRSRAIAARIIAA